MARSSSPDAQLQRLAELRTQAVSDEMRDAVRAGLRTKSNIVVAKAAVVAREKRLRELIPELLERFERHMVDPLRSDRGCDAKIAIVTALHELDCDDAAAFLRGLRHVQIEGGFGRTDTAAPLRAVSAVALARTPYPRVLEAILPLLVDPEPNVRVAAAQAIGAAGRIEGQLLLRLKVLAGDHETDVIAECLVSLLSLSGRDALEFVVDECLDSDDPAKRDAAALALGASRLGESFELLRQRFERTSDVDFRSVLLVAIGTSRDESAAEFLVKQVESAPVPLAVEALRALKVHASDTRVRERAAQIVSSRGEPALDRAMRETFP